MSVDSLFEAWERAWSGRDPRAFAAICAADVHYEDPLTPRPLQGPEAIAAHAARLWQAFPDARLNPTGERLVSGRFAAAPHKLLATHRGAMPALPATHRSIVVHGVAYAEMDAGRLQRVRVFFDLYGIAVQLGIMPHSGSAGERALMLLRGFGLRRRG
ncbi:MAG: ester cyclase [Actinomycetota bacterium]|nr:ester cyclase [Actinomycetota bacterium]